MGKPDKKDIVKKSSKTTTGCACQPRSTNVSRNEFLYIRVVIYFLVFMIILLLAGLGMLCKTVLFMQDNLDKVCRAVLNLKSLLDIGVPTDV